MGVAELIETYGGLDCTAEYSAGWMIEAGFQLTRNVKPMWAEAMSSRIKSDDQLG